MSSDREKLKCFGAILQLMQYVWENKRDSDSVLNVVQGVISSSNSGKDREEKQVVERLKKDILDNKLAGSINNGIIDYPVLEYRYYSSNPESQKGLSFNIDINGRKLFQHDWTTIGALQVNSSSGYLKINLDNGDKQFFYGELQKINMSLRKTILHNALS